MTLLSTKFNAAPNWSQRLPIARDIMKEVRAESDPYLDFAQKAWPADSYTEVQIDVKSIEEKTLELLTGRTEPTA